MKRRAGRIFVAGLLCMLIACARQFSPHGPRGEALSAVAKQQALDVCRRSTAEVRSFRALSRTRVEHGEDRTTLRQVMVFASAGKFRIEALPTNGAYTLNLIVADSGRLLALDPEEKTARQAPLNSGLLRKVLHIPLNEADLMPLIAGRIPLRFLENEGAVYREPGSNRLYLADSAGKVFFEADSGDCLLKKAEFLDPFNDRLSLRIVYGENCPAEDLRLPCRLNVENVSDGLSSELSFSNFSVNREYPAGLFCQEIPSDFRIVE